MLFRTRRSLAAHPPAGFVPAAVLPAAFLLGAGFLSALLLSPAEAAAQPRASAATERPVAQAVRTEAVIRIDGRLDEAAWAAAPVLSDFVQNTPFDGRPASEITEVRVLFDDEALYVGARMLDREPGGILAGENRRDASLAEADAFLILLDTYLDGQNGFVFGTTPAGIEYDGQVTREGQGGAQGQRMQRGSGGGFNINWDGSWDVATSRDAEGWTAEFRIPFSTLRYERGGEQFWGLNFSRKIRRRNEESFWSPIPLQYDLYRVSMAGRLEGLEAPARRTVTLIPYALTSARREYVPGISTETAWDVGGDAKVGLGPNLTLDLTVNTDFAQVEVDDQQLNLTRFNLFFPEKRPFFLENAGTFSAGSAQAVELFFSRRIGIEAGREAPIVAGGRLTGRLGGTTLGLLSVQTGALDIPVLDTGPGADPGLPVQTERVAPANHFSVARAIRELPNRSRVGTILVSRLNTDDTSDYNLTLGADGRWGIGENTTVDGYAARTVTPGMEGGQYAVSVSAQYTLPDWRLNFSAREVAEGFNPEVGFLPRSDYRFVSASVLRRYRFEDIDWFQELRPHVNYREHFGLDGFSETRWIHIDSHFEFSNGAFFQFPAVNFTREGLRRPFRIAPDVTVPAGTYDNVEWGFAANTDRSAPLALDARVDIGGFYNGFRKGGALTLTGRLGDATRLSARAQYYDVDLDTGDFTTSLFSLQAAYSFTPRIYVQTLVQYNDQTRNLSSNLRFGWLNTAGTGLFVVFNDLEHAGPFDRTGLDRGPLERTVVVKFTRQWMPLG
jgi:hypothetical protein